LRERERERGRERERERVGGDGATVPKDHPSMTRHDRTITVPRPPLFPSSHRMKRIKFCTFCLEMLNCLF